jgi:hypothetical protein
VVVAVAVAAGVPLMMALVTLVLTSLPPLAIPGVLAEIMALLRLAQLPVTGAQVTTTRATTLVEAVGAPLIPRRLLRLLGKRSILLLSILLGEAALCVTEGWQLAGDWDFCVDLSCEVFPEEIQEFWGF